MARRSDDDGEKSKRRTDRGQEQEQEQAQQRQAELETQTEEHESAYAQNQYGNQGLLSLLAPPPPDGGAGAGSEMHALGRKQDLEKEGVDYGGDDDPIDPTLFDLSSGPVRGNPTTQQPTERPEFIEPMPDDSLPPEDPTFLASVVSDLIPNDTDFVDYWLQPSIELLVRSLQGWSHGATRWAGDHIHQRAWAHILHGTPLLLDPDGQVLFSRVREVVLSQFLLLDTDLFANYNPEISQGVHFLLEFEGRQYRVRDVRQSLDPKSRPMAFDLFTALEGEPQGQVTPVPLSSGWVEAMNATLTSLLGLEDARLLIPRFEAALPRENELDEPLDVDAVISQFTSGERSRDDAGYRGTLQAAERVASALQLSRVRAAGVVVALADTCRGIGQIPPNKSFSTALIAHDQELSRILLGLRELAVATQRRSMTIPELADAITAAAQQLEQARYEFRQHLMVLIAGLLPFLPQIPIHPTMSEDPLTAAWADGNPAAALPWLQQQSDSLEIHAAIVFTRLKIELDPKLALSQLLPLRHQAIRDGASLLDIALGVMIGAIALTANDELLAMEHAQEQRRQGRQRFNGFLLLHGTLLAMEVLYRQGEEQRAEQLRHEDGCFLYSMQAQAALSLLARWQPRELQIDPP